MPVAKSAPTDEKNRPGPGRRRPDRGWHRHRGRIRRHHPALREPARRPERPRGRPRPAPLAGREDRPDGADPGRPPLRRLLGLQRRPAQPRLREAGARYRPRGLDPVRRRRRARRGLLPEHAADVGHADQRDGEVRDRATPRTTSRSSTAPTSCTATTTSSARRCSRSRSAWARASTRRWSRRCSARPARRRPRPTCAGPSRRSPTSTPTRGGAGTTSPSARTRRSTARCPRPRSRGLQKSPTVAATVKHFAGYGASDSGLDRTPTDMSLRTFQTYQLPSYAKAIDSGALSVMVNSGSINGIPATGSKYLLRTVLRKQLGFTGVTISDWQDVLALQTKYHVVGDYEHAIAQAVNAGIDVTMEPYDADGFVTNLKAAVHDRLVTRTTIDQAVDAGAGDEVPARAVRPPLRRRRPGRPASSAPTRRSPARPRRSRACCCATRTSAAAGAVEQDRRHRPGRRLGRRHPRRLEHRLAGRSGRQHRDRGDRAARACRTPAAATSPTPPTQTAAVSSDEVGRRRRGRARSRPGRRRPERPARPDAAGRSAGAGRRRSRRPASR